ncbi:MAG: helix-turn-helix domain-containing protein [Deltaproteobacteria bacterium]|nr:helix-turn-helix domain-containing protein [Deltaproteobacteria bacterium]
MPDNTFLKPKQAAERLGLTARCLEAWRHRGGGPRYVKAGYRIVRYRPEDLDSWVAERLVTSTSDAAARAAGKGRS